MTGLWWISPILADFEQWQLMQNSNKRWERREQMSRSLLQCHQGTHRTQTLRTSTLRKAFFCAAKQSKIRRGERNPCGNTMWTDLLKSLHTFPGAQDEWHFGRDSILSPNSSQNMVAVDVYCCSQIPAAKYARRVPLIHCTPLRLLLHNFAEEANLFKKFIVVL